MVVGRLQASRRATPVRGTAPYQGDLEPDEEEGSAWVTPGTAEGDRETIEADLLRH
jgi:hypothetical protein